MRMCPNEEHLSAIARGPAVKQLGMALASQKR
jgi:hypothetical protein